MVQPWMLKAGTQHPPNRTPLSPNSKKPNRLSDRELATVLAALRFWQSHGPPQPNSDFDRLESDDQDALDEIQTGSGRFDPLTTEDIDHLCERLNSGDGFGDAFCKAPVGSGISVGLG
jgi:hypothetical protein